MEKDDDRPLIEHNSRESQSPGHSRRSLLIGAAALASGALLDTAPAKAAAPQAHQQVAGVYRRRVGDFEITALLDRYIDVGHEYRKGIDKPAVEQAAAAHFLPNNGKVRIGVTSYHINTGKQSILIDSGAAGLFGPTAAKFAQSLAAASISPDSVDTVLLTHMHPDHIGALITDKGAAVFKNANVHVSAVDSRFWTADSNQTTAPDFAKPWFDAAKRVTNAYRGHLQLFNGAPELTPGVTAVSLQGHTPGHTGYLVSSGGEQLPLWR